MLCNGHSIFSLVCVLVLPPPIPLPFLLPFPCLSPLDSPFTLLGFAKFRVKGLSSLHIFDCFPPFLQAPVLDMLVHVSQTEGSENSWLSIPMEDPCPDSLQFSVAQKQWQPLAAIPDGKAVSDHPYATLNGNIRILRGAKWLAYEIRLQVWGTLPNCSCGYLTLLTTFHRAAAFPIFQTALGSLPAHLQERFNTIVRLGHNVECDLSCIRMRVILCKFAIECLVSPSDSIQKLIAPILRHEWRNQPDTALYAEATCLARELDMNDIIPDTSDPDAFPKRNAIVIMAPTSYYNSIVQTILQAYLGFTMAIVIFQKHKVGSRVHWVHQAVLDSVHPTESILWCPMLQRDNGHSAASNHYLAVTNADGGCPIWTFPV